MLTFDIKSVNYSRTVGIRFYDNGLTNLFMKLQVSIQVSFSIVVLGDVGEDLLNHCMNMVKQQYWQNIWHKGYKIYRLPVHQNHYHQHH